MSQRCDFQQRDFVTLVLKRGRLPQKRQGVAPQRASNSPPKRLCLSECSVLNMWSPFHLFLAVLVFFHTSEFALAALFNPSLLEWSCEWSPAHRHAISTPPPHRPFLPHSAAWLISAPYAAAMALAAAEYWLEASLAPWLHVSWATRVGLGMVAAGEALRKAGIITAGANFTQRLLTQRRAQHRLVKSGIYAWMRHPGYAGWVLWAVGTQVILCNPVCTLVFAYLVSRERRRTSFPFPLLTGPSAPCDRRAGGSCGTGSRWRTGCCCRSSARSGRDGGRSRPAASPASRSSGVFERILRRRKVQSVVRNNCEVAVAKLHEKGDERQSGRKSVRGRKRGQPRGYKRTCGMARQGGDTYKPGRWKNGSPVAMKKKNGTAQGYIGTRPFKSRF